MKILKITLFLILVSSKVYAGTNYFNEGLTFYNNQELFHENMRLQQMLIQAGILHPRTTFRSIGMNGTTTPTPTPSHSSTSR